MHPDFFFYPLFNFSFPIDVKKDCISKTDIQPFLYYLTLVFKITEVRRLKGRVVQIQVILLS